MDHLSITWLLDKTYEVVNRTQQTVVGKPPPKLTKSDRNSKVGI